MNSGRRGASLLSSDAQNGLQGEASVELGKVGGVLHHREGHDERGLTPKKVGARIHAS